MRLRFFFGRVGALGVEGPRGRGPVLVPANSGLRLPGVGVRLIQGERRNDVHPILNNLAHPDFPFGKRPFFSKC